MTDIRKHLKLSTTVGLLGLLIVPFGCEDYLEAEDPVGQLSTEAVYENENTATAAITSLYAILRDEVILTGNPTGIGGIMGLYSDELDYYGQPGESLENFYRHQTIASNPTISDTWNGAYNLIFMCNAAIEGLEGSQSLTNEVKEKLKGEALFIRGMIHFYLVNIFGDIPYIKTTDYLINSEAERMPSEIVYENIIEDLENSKNLLAPSYPTGKRIRANKWVGAALLAKVYLYNRQWEKAEHESNLLLNNSEFVLEEDIQNEFLKESTSAILQLKPKNNGDNTLEGSTFIFSSGPPPLMALNISLIEDMEDSDLRKQNWIKSLTEGSDTWFFPFKYKQNLNTGTSVEYSIVLRISEQYLIRAEARLMQGNNLGAENDLNIIRQRAGLENTNAQNSQELFDAIIMERRFEFFSEYGNRWFDLRRLGIAEEILSPIKIGWKSTDILFPIPESELLLNPKLEPQNPGY